MKLNSELLKLFGLTEVQIQQVQRHCDAEEKAGRFSYQPALLRLNGRILVSCKSMAKFMVRLYPGCWLEWAVPPKAKVGSTVPPKTKRPNKTRKPAKPKPRTTKHRGRATVTKTARSKKRS